jgi:hypothetical protein
MSQLVLNAIPGFFDLADSAIAAGQPLTDDSMLNISRNAKFGAVRSKLIFMGFYANGNTVPTPIDPDDGYAYSRTECQFVWMIYSNRAPAPGFVPGQASPPAQSSSQAAPLYDFPGGWDINDLTGLVTLWTTYYSPGGAETINNDGIVKVYAICSRLSLTSRPGPPAPPAPIRPSPTPPTPSPPAGTQLATVSLSSQTAALGSASSPLVIFTVGSSDATFRLTATIDCNVPATQILNSEGVFAGATLTLTYGWMNSGSSAPAEIQISAMAFSDPANSDGSNGHVSVFLAAAGSTIWYYTTWTVDSALPPGSYYDLSIVLEQIPS